MAQPAPLRDDVCANAAENHPADGGTPRVFGDPRLETFFRHWRARLTATAWPRRADLDPIEIPRVLPHVMITQRAAGGAEYLRVVGTHIVDHLGFDPTRRELNTMAGDANFADLCLELLAEMRLQNAPLYATGRHFSPRGATRTCSRVLLPLSDGDGAVDAAAHCIVFAADAAAVPIAAGGPAVREHTERVAMEPAQPASGPIA